MKKKCILMSLLILTALLFSGCAMRTINEMYSLPKRSEAYDNLQSAVDIAMAGLEYSAPMTGENQQAVQTADLNGDGREEYLVFTKGSFAEPMQILIFAQENEDVQIMEVISSNGSAFDQVEYAEIDGKPGQELIVGRRVSDQLMGSVAIYSFASGRAERLLNAGYSQFVTYDLGGSDQKEVLLIQRGESDADNAVAVLYRYRSKSMARSVEVRLSNPAQNVKRITPGKLQCGTAAVYISTISEDNSVYTDILALQDDSLVKLEYSNVQTSGVGTLRNYYVYAEDMDDDGIIEIPSLISVNPVSASWQMEEQYQVRWYSVDIEGNRTEKRSTFHNYDGGWYLELDNAWADYVTVYQVGNTYAFYMWNDTYKEAIAVFTVFALTGSDRMTQSTEDGRFALHHGDSVIYAVRFESDVSKYGITKEYMTKSFHLIHKDWNTGDT